MSVQFWPAKVRSSLSARLFFVLLPAVLLILLGNYLMAEWVRTRVVETEVLAGAEQASAFLEGSLLTEMAENNRQHIHDAVSRLGENPDVVGVRIFNKRGQIAFSSDTSEIGSQVDMSAQACFACHETELPVSIPEPADMFRIHRHRDGYRVLRLITPIRSRPGCSDDCHVHGPTETVLGVLDVQMSMAETDAAMLSAERFSLGISLLISLLLGGAIAWIVHRAVHRPTRELMRGTEALAAGDLRHRLDIDREDELGRLADSFNRMAASLKQANDELRNWSDTLAERVRDRTHELAVIHKQMVQVEKTSSLGKMAATVAHELNNPLSGILTCSRLVARKVERGMPAGDDRDSTLENLELIRSESIRCGNIVRDLLSYARGGTHEFTPAHLHALVEHASSLMNHHLQLGSVQLQTRLSLSDDQIVCDGEQIVQTLLALMINAVEAMPEGGELTISTCEDPGDKRFVLLKVADTGTGIPAEIRDRIFDPFFSTKNETKGVGLGLAVVFGIVRRHGGTVSVESPPEEGAVFTLRLPRRPARQYETEVGSEGVPVGAGPGNEEVG
jgi:two-component system NtrC family sensor kinase